MKKMIEQYESRKVQTWSNKDIDRTKKVEKTSTPANLKKAINHFEAGYQERKRRQSKKMKVLGYAALIGLTSGLAAGLATEMSAASEQHSDKSPVSWVGNSIDTAIDNAEDIIHPSNFESIGEQSVIAHEGDSVIGLIEQNVRGYAKLNSEQFRILFDQTMDRNGLGSDDLLQIGQSLVLPEKVEN